MREKLNIQAVFFKQVNIAPLIIFRIIFGALMLFGSLRFISKGWVSELYIFPDFHFSYYGFSWLKVLPGNWMFVPFVLMVLASCGILFGAFYRVSSSLFFITFTYVELLDKSYYLNHYYFVSLVALLMIFLPANRLLSVDAYRKPQIVSQQTANWTIWVLRFQLAIVYIFAGIAKLNSDWLFEAQPLKIWLQAYRDTPIIGKLFSSSFLAFAFSWFGCLYDLSIPFFLSFKKTRNVAYFFVIVFHLVTWLLFPIGVFPWVMIFSTLIFFSAEFHQKLVDFFQSKLNLQKQVANLVQKPNKRIILSLLSFYILFQILFPFRYLLYSGNLPWSEEGMRFSWRVMLMHKEGLTTFYVKDRKTGGEIEIDNTKYLTNTQIDQMATQPDFILQYANYLHDQFKDTLLVYGAKKVHLINPSIHAESFVSLNGRQSKKFVDKKKDLTQIQNNLSARTWLESY